MENKSENSVKAFLTASSLLLDTCRKLNATERLQAYQKLHDNLLLDMLKVLKDHPNLESFEGHPDIEATRKIQEILKIYNVH